MKFYSLEIDLFFHKCGPASRHHAAEADIEPIKTHVEFAKGMNGVLMPSFSFLRTKATILDGLSLARTDSISIV